MVATPALFEEPEMIDTRNEQREGYCDGIAGRYSPQSGRSKYYLFAWLDGATDNLTLYCMKALRAFA